MFGGFIGGWEIIFLLLALVCFVVVVVIAIVAIVFFTSRTSHAGKNQKPPAAPVPSPPAVPATQIVPAKCPQCGTALPTGALAGLCPACLLKMGAADSVTDAKQKAFVPPDISELAAKFPQLEILELIGKGGMGAVYKARQKQLDRIVALKILPPGIGDEPAFAERFTREAKALAKLNHPNIVTLYEFGDAGGQFYFLMEFVDGVNLRQLLAGGRVSAREALAIVPQICDALQFAHDQGIVHRDIKPENILLDRRGRVKVADFGLAKIIENRAPLTPSLSPSDGERVAEPGEGATILTDAGKTMGTPNYMSPEQITAPGEVDHRADIYALGVVFYQMLTGELPGKKIEPPSKKVQIDVRLDEIVLRALEKNPELRFQQVSEVRTCVETIVATPGSAGVAPGSASDKFVNEPSGATPDGTRGTRALPETPPHFSRTAIVGTACSAFFFLSALAFVCLRHISLEDFDLPYLEPIILSVLFITPFAMTILGWIAVSQIRRSAGKIYGMWLAVFDGLLFPLLALDGLIFAAVCLVIRFADLGWKRTFPPTVPLSYLLFVAVLLGILLLLDWLIIRRVWRAVNKSPSLEQTAPPSSSQTLSRWLLFALVIIVIGMLGFAVLRIAPNANSSATSLANRPDKLRSLPTATVIQAGLSEPQSPWAWQELQSRARDGRLNAVEANQLVADLAAQIQRDYPNGYDQPLNWLGNLLDDLNGRQLIAETNKLAFLVAYCGNPAIEPLPRLREDEKSLQVTCKLRSPWNDGHIFGFDLLNEVRSISIDGQPVPVRAVFGRNWNQQDFVGELKPLILAPGKYTVRCEVESALVATTDMAGLAADATSKDWPPAQHRWTRAAEAELTVYPLGGEIVSLSDNPTLNPVTAGALSAGQIIIRPKGGRLTATVALNMKTKPGLPVSVDVILRLAGQDFKCGNYWFDGKSTQGGFNPTPNGWTFTADIGTLDPQIKEAEIVLTPDPKAVESRAGVERIWGKEIIFSHVPLARQDLPEDISGGTNPADVPNFSFGRVMQFTLPMDHDGLTPLFDLDQDQPVSDPNPNDMAAGMAQFLKPGVVIHHDEPAHKIALLGISGTVLYWASVSLGDQWEKLTDTNGIAAVRRNMTSPGVIQSIDSPDKLPQTVFFKTGAGRLGILQITGFTENPRGVKIRYKLVQSETAMADSSVRDFVAVLPPANEAAVHDACLRFVFAQNWMPFERWWQGGMAVQTADHNGKAVTFTLSRQTDGTTRFTINVAPGASISATEIGAQLGLNQLIQIQTPAATAEMKINN
jgi:serine/threonine protein kinase